MPLALLLSVFVVATCGLVYELIAGALASYLLGDSITQFSTVIGVYLFAMGVGSFASRYAQRTPLKTFIKVEILVGVLGGCSSTLLFFAFAHGAFFQLVLYGLVFLIGLGVGLEIPLLMTILKDDMSFTDVVSRVLGFDYIGSLVASIAFPIVLLPHLGLVRTAALFGILNVAVALGMIFSFARSQPTLAPLKIFASLAMALLTVLFVLGDDLVGAAEAAIYPDRVVYASNTKYQRVVLTRSRSSIRLHLNGHLQFDSADEYRYHESLVHLAMSGARSRRRVLVLGGGDGFAVREILKYPDVESITLVDLDPAMTVLFRDSELLSALNGRSLLNQKVHVINEDAFVWLRERKSEFDCVIIDFPDPTNFSIGKLYTTAFYRALKEAITPEGVAVIQSTSPLLARESFWSVDATVRSAGFETSPYHAYVPSFGEWGFVIAHGGGFSPSPRFPPGLRFIAPEVLPSLFFFPPDMSRISAPVNRLNDQLLVHLYEKEWGRYGL